MGLFIVLTDDVMWEIDFSSIKHKCSSLKLLTYERVLGMCHRLEEQRQECVVMECCASENLCFSKLVLQGKSILLMIYRYGFSFAQICGLKISNFRLDRDHIEFVDDGIWWLETAHEVDLYYHETVAAWYRIRRYEKNQTYLFGNISISGDLSSCLMSRGDLYSVIEYLLMTVFLKSDME